MLSHIGSPQATQMILASGPFSSVIQNTPTGPALDHAARERRLVEEHQGVERVAVLGQRVGHEPVVGRVERRGEEPPVEPEDVVLVVVLVLVPAPPGDLHHDVDRAVRVHVPCPFLGGASAPILAHRRTAADRRRRCPTGPAGVPGAPC